MNNLKFGKAQCNAFMSKIKLMSKREDLDFVRRSKSGYGSMIP